MAPPTQCSTCGKAATNRCAGCKRTVYCNKDCQVKDWKDHKVACKDAQLEQIVERAADIIQQVFFTFRRHTFDTPIIKVEEKEGRLNIFDGVVAAKKTWFETFPDHLIESESVKAGVLSAWMCDEPIAFIKKTIVSLFQGHKIQLNEVMVTLKNVPRITQCIWPTGYVQPNWPAYRHRVIRATSTVSGRQWLVDVSGGQYGFIQSCWDWPDFEGKHVETINQVKKLGAAEEELRCLARIEGYPDMTYGLGWDAADYADAAVALWVAKEIALSKVVTCGSEEYGRKKDGLLATVNKAMRIFVATAGVHKRWRAAVRYEAMNPGLSQLMVSQHGSHSNVL